MRSAIRDHSSMRRAPSISNDSVETWTEASTTASLTSRSSKEKNPSRHDMSSKTTVSIWSRTWRSSSRAPIAPIASRISPSRRVSPAACSRVRVSQIRFADPAGADQHGAERVRAAAHARRDDASAIEQDDALVVAQLGGHAQRPRLPTQIQQLEDVVDAQLSQRAFDRH